MNALPDSLQCPSNGSVKTAKQIGPVSFLQERLWFLHELRDCGAAFHSAFAVRVTGRLNKQALERALNQIIDRHESFRTVFREENGTVLQQVVSFEGPPFVAVEIQPGLDSDIDARVREIVSHDFSQPFNLATGPLIRIKLLCAGADQHVLLMCSHKIVCDSASWMILVSELRSLYFADQAAQFLGPSEVPLRFIEYSSSQREFWQEKGDSCALDYWKRTLTAIPALLSLPTDYPRPAVQSYRGSTCKVELPSSLLETLATLAHRRETTSFTVLLAAWKVVLARSTGSSEIVVGTPFDGRTSPELERVVGALTNTVVLRTDVSPDLTFGELIERIDKVVHSGKANSNVPFEKLISELQPERSLSYAPLFQVAFQWIQVENLLLGSDGLLLSLIPLNTDATPFDLELIIHSERNYSCAQLIYSSDLFEKSTISRLLEHYVVLLRAALENLDTRLSALPLMTTEEQSLVLREWNKTDLTYPPSLTIHKAFENQAEYHPAKTAIISQGKEFSYCELNERANQLAWTLQESGIQPEQLIAICVDRCFDMVVAVLAILKAGAAYVPLDPAHPPDRIKYILEDSGASLVITQSSLLPHLPAHSGITICVDTATDKIERQKHQNGAACVTSRQLAYVLYTSGSTGKPKGVQITHRNVVNFLSSMQREPGIKSRDILLAVTTLSFDIAGLELFLPLVSGATVVLASRTEVSDGGKLRELIDYHQVTFLQATPATWSLLLEAGWSGKPELKALCGGEALSMELANQLLPRCGELWNMYGPTETTIWSTLFSIQEELCGIAPIGRPIGNTKVYVLDANLQPVPIGVAGELYISGDGVGLGYLNRPTLNKQRFLPDPFSEGQRMYRTGDRLRWRANGTLDFLGRLDEQVKIRGFRIEPGEVESELTKLPGVRESCVVVRDEPPGGKRLVAYVVGEVEHEQLRVHLRRNLPEYMIPAQFVTLECFPLTPNGKLNRAALPAPQLGNRRRDAEPLRNLIERQLATLWEELIGIDDVGPTQDFFELGGHSLLAMRLFNQIQRTFKCDLPLSTLFTGATVRQMAAAILETQRSSSSTGRATPVVPLQPNGSLPPLFCVHPAGRDVYPYVRLAYHLGVNQPVYGVRDHSDELGRPLLQIARDHVEAIRGVQPQGPYYLLGYSFGVIITYEMAVYLESQGQTVAFLGVLDMVEPGRANDQSIVDDAAILTMLAFGQVTPDELTGMALENQLRYVAEALEKSGAAPRGFDAVELREQFELVRARQDCVNGYLPGLYSGRVSLFRASEMRDIDQGFVSWMEGWTDEERETYSWSRRTPARVDVYPVPGTHMSMLREPHVIALAQNMQQALAAARTRQNVPHSGG